MGNGATSRRYEAREPFQFAVREVSHDTRSGSFWVETYHGTTLTVAGRFKDSEPFTGLFLVRLNSAWFQASMLDSSKAIADGNGAGRLKLQPGEHHFFVDTLDESVALALKKQLEQLR